MLPLHYIAEETAHKEDVTVEDPVKRQEEEDENLMTPYKLYAEKWEALEAHNTDTRNTKMEAGVDDFLLVEGAHEPVQQFEVSLGADFYSQALKVLSDRSPFDSAEVLVTTVPTLPIALGNGLLARQSEGRKRHKKSHGESKSSKYGPAERPKSSSLWVDYEEYFRQLTLSDIDMLQKWSTSFELLVSGSCLCIPVVRNQVDSDNVSDAPDYATCGVKDASLHEETAGILDLPLDDELEREHIYIHKWLSGHAAKRKSLSDKLICKIVKNLPEELQVVRKQRWDSVLVHQYLHELREAKKQGRKERKYKEAQEILAAATAAAAASSRTSLRKDDIEESSRQPDKLNAQTPRVRAVPPSLAIPRVRETNSCLAMSRHMSDKHLSIMQLSTHVSKEHLSYCGICERSETILNPILICSSCKVAVHLGCYRNLKDTPGPWYCELCENSPAKGSIVQAENSSHKLNPDPITECSLCGTANGAFRKTSSGQWVHALCAEWVLESTYRRGQSNPIDGMESVVRRNDVCSVCHQRLGVCIKCNFGPCQSTFHPFCARSAGYYMSVRFVGGKPQRRAYCDKHSIEQRSKVEGQKHGIDELKSIKQVRVELEKLRLILERIVKREKLKRELVLCSHDLLVSKMDTLVFSPLFQSALFPPEYSSESATTSLKGQTDCSRSCSTMQKSDDATVDSTVSAKRHIKFLVSGDRDQRTEDSLTSQQLPAPKSTGRASFAGKHIPIRPSITCPNIQETAGQNLKSRKHTETFEKELIMTSDQASVKNQRLPKGYIYVPIDRLSASTEEQTEH